MVKSDMDSRKRLRLDDVMTMLDTEDDFDEPMEEGSDDEFPDMVMSIMEENENDTGNCEEMQEEAALVCTCKYAFSGNHNQG